MSYKPFVDIHWFNEKKFFYVHVEKEFLNQIAAILKLAAIAT